MANRPRTVTVDVADKRRGITVRGEIRIEGASPALAEAIAREFDDASARAYAHILGRTPDLTPGCR